MLAPFRVLISHRQAIQIFVNRDIRGRYINSALGLWWAVIQPLALLALYTFVFSRVMSVRLSESASTGEFALYAVLRPASVAGRRGCADALGIGPLRSDAAHQEGRLSVGDPAGSSGAVGAGRRDRRPRRVPGGRDRRRTAARLVAADAADRDRPAVLLHDRDRVAAVDACRATCATFARSSASC